jgi:hypothetical protein
MAASRFDCIFCLKILLVQTRKTHTEPPIHREEIHSFGMFSAHFERKEKSILILEVHTGVGVLFFNIHIDA